MGEEVAKLADHIHRRKRLLGVVGGARILTASAAGTGIEVEQLFPGKLRQGVRPDVPPDTQPVHGPERSQGTSLQQDVYRRHQDMGEPEVGKESEEAKHTHQMENPKDPMEEDPAHPLGKHGLQDGGQRVPADRVDLELRPIVADPGRLDQESGKTQQKQSHEEKDIAAATVEFLRPLDVSPENRQRNPGNKYQSGQIG